MIKLMSVAIVCSCSLLSENCHDSCVWTFALSDDGNINNLITIFPLKIIRALLSELSESFIAMFYWKCRKETSNNETLNQLLSSSSFLLPLSISARKCIFKSWPFIARLLLHSSASLKDLSSVLVAAQRASIHVFIFNSIPKGDFVVILSS